MALKITNPQFKQLTATTQRKTYTVGLATVAIVALMVFFAIRPAISSIFDQISVNEENQKTLDKMNDKYNALLSLQTQEEEGAQILGYFDRAFPDDRQEDFVLANLIELTEKNNLEFKSSQIQYEQVEPVVVPEGGIDLSTQAARVAFSVEGDRDDVLALVQDMENFVRIFNITKFSTVSKISETGGEIEQVVGSFELEVFYYENTQVLED